MLHSWQKRCSFAEGFAATCISTSSIISIGCRAVRNRFKAEPLPPFEFRCVARCFSFLFFRTDLRCDPLGMYRALVFPELFVEVSAVDPGFGPTFRDIEWYFKVESKERLHGVHGKESMNN